MLIKPHHYGGRVVKWLMYQTINLRITSQMALNPVTAMWLFPCARSLTLNDQNWLVPEMDLRVYL